MSARKILSRARRPIVFWPAVLFFLGWLTAPDVLRQYESSSAGSLDVIATGSAQQVGKNGVQAGKARRPGVEPGTDVAWLLPEPEAEPLAPGTDVDQEENEAEVIESFGIAPILVERAPSRTRSSSGEEEVRTPRTREGETGFAPRRDDAFAPGIIPAGFGGGFAGSPSGAPALGSPAAGSGATGAGGGGTEGSAPPSSGGSSAPSPPASSDDGGGFDAAGDEDEEENGLLAALAEAVRTAIERVLDDPIEHGVLILRFLPVTTEAQQAEILEILDPSRGEQYVDLIDAWIVRIPESADVLGVLDVLARFPIVESVWPSHRFAAVGRPNDDHFGDQWGLDNTGQAGGLGDADIDAPEAWGLVDHRFVEVRVGVVDTGFERWHPDLAGNVAGYDPNGGAYSAHGTAVAGALGALTNNHAGVAGASLSHARLYLAEAGVGDAEVSEAEALLAISWLVQNQTKVVNLSFAAPLTLSGTPAICVAIAAASNTLFVAAAGNSGSSVQHFPAACDEILGGSNVLSVAASTRHDLLWGASNYGPWVDVAAPGQAILTTAPGGYGPLSGTSLAAASVSGIASLVASQNPGRSPAQIKSRILNGTDFAVGTAIYGLGRANMCKALGGNCIYLPGLPF